MVKSVLDTNHQGLRDWVIQRASALLIGFYLLALIFYFICHPALSYGEWRELFTHQWMKIATLLFTVSLLFHAWIGVWTIFTDYVKSYVFRAVLNFCVLLMLAVCFIWSVLILWSV